MATGRLGRITLGPRRFLEIVRLGIRNGNLGAVKDIIDEAIEQLPPDDPPEETTPVNPCGCKCGHVVENQIDSIVYALFKYHVRHEIGCAADSLLSQECDCGLRSEIRRRL